MRSRVARGSKAPTRLGRPLEADRDLATQLLQLRGVVALPQEVQRLLNDLVLRGVEARLDQGGDELLLGFER